jgi:hypothetical protein
VLKRQDSQRNLGTMASLQGPGWENQVVLPGCKEVCECTTGWADNIASLIWWLFVGVCMWHAPQLLANWLDVSLPGLDFVFLNLR